MPQRAALPIEFGPITDQNVEMLRKVNSACFPISYNDKFYKDVVALNQNRNSTNGGAAAALNKFAYYKGFVVGAVCTRIESLSVSNNSNNNSGSTSSLTCTTPNESSRSSNNTCSTNEEDTTETATTAPSSSRTTNSNRLYIMTLGVLAAYRGRQVGTQLIQSVLDQAKNKDDDYLEDVDEIALHVQISNDDAIRFYTQGFGFIQGEMVENYYRRINPPHCYLLYKKLK